jgi:5-methylcytosine-specific restriction endonuclease McrA
MRYVLVGGDVILILYKTGKMRVKKISKWKLNKQNCTIAKLIAKQRDGYTCQHCWRKDNIHWSHIINEARDHRLACDPYNIKALCYNCHLNWWHKNPLDASEWFEKKRPWRKETLQEIHIKNQSLWTISYAWVEEQNIKLKSIAKEMWIAIK